MAQLIELVQFGQKGIVEKISHERWVCESVDDRFQLYEILKKKLSLIMAYPKFWSVYFGPKVIHYSLYTTCASIYSLFIS